MITRSVRSLARGLAAKLKPKPPITMLDYVEKYGYITSPSDGRQSVKNWMTNLTYSDHPTREGFMQTMHCTAGSVGARNQSR